MIDYIVNGVLFNLPAVALSVWVVFATDHAFFRRNDDGNK